MELAPQPSGYDLASWAAWLVLRLLSWLLPIRRQWLAALEAEVLIMSSANMTCSSRPVYHAHEPPGLMTLVGIPLGEEVSDAPGRQAISLPGLV